MATNTKKRDLLSSRRRVEDEGEDDEGAEDLGDDSQSEASILTMDENGVADESDLSEISKSEALLPAVATGVADSSLVEGTKPLNAPLTNGAVSDEATTTVFSQNSDVEAMVNGLKIGETSANEEALEFEDSTDHLKPVVEVAKSNVNSAAPGGHQNGRGGRQQTRGAGFRTAANAVNGHRTAQAVAPPVAMNEGITTNNLPSVPIRQPTSGAIRGRVSGIVNNGSFPCVYMHDEHEINANHYARRPLPPHAPASNAKWSHDLHETVQATPLPQPQQAKPVIPSQSTLAPKPLQRPSLSRTVPRGNVAARIFLPNMKAPQVLDSKITIKEHTRLPDLRPPLRRDKAVRISLPEHSPRYVFPSWDRSFVFIPRAQRPNQQAKLRRGYGSRGGSRRTSMHGSVYSPSVAMSRRSSMAGNGILSPNGSMLGRPPPGAPTGPGRPVVRFPNHSAGTFMQSGHGHGMAMADMTMTYPLPSEPAQRKHRSSQMAMHHPRPQKQMSVASIEGEQQPFHQQLPYNTNTGTQSQDARVPSAANTIPSQPHVATPLQNIPESAVNAPAFEPFNGPGPAQPQPYFYPMQPLYYYPAPPPDPHPQAQPPPPYAYPPMPMASPGYMQAAPYFTPLYVPTHGHGPSDVNINVNPNTYMQETNGMIYYYDSSQMPNSQGQGQGRGPGAGAGAMMAPAPEFYPAQPPPAAAFYPPQ